MQRRLKISSKDLKYVLAFFIITTIVVSASVYLEMEAASTDQFFSMSILDANGLTENYFPNNNPNLIVGETVNWTLGIYNHNSALQYVVLRVKLLNATQIAPNELTGAPSPVDAIFEFARVLTSNETWAVPFVWAIMNETDFRGSLKITGLMINQTLITGNLGEANSGLNFRMVFELWFYNPATDRLAFSQTTTTASYAIWTQLWFNATAT